MSLPAPIILDTNVVSESLRANPDQRVGAWFARQPRGSLFLTSTVIAEISVGVKSLPEGVRRRRFERWLRRLIEEEFAQRVLCFGVDCALIFGRMVAHARAIGRPAGVADAQIAAVAEREGMAIATRDVRDFEIFGVPLINPWQETEPFN